MIFRIYRPNTIGLVTACKLEVYYEYMNPVDQCAYVQKLFCQLMVFEQDIPAFIHRQAYVPHL